MSVKAAWALAKNAVASKRVPCAVFGVVDPQGGRQVFYDGHAQIVPDPVLVTRHTEFDLASLTKPLFTAQRILNYAHTGKLDLDAPITSVIQDFCQYHGECWERRVTFRDCLGHRTYFPAVAPIYTYGQDPGTLRAFVLQREWARVKSPVYSDINYILLGIALERIELCTINQMQPDHGLTFSPNPKTCAATENCTWRGRILRGEVHDENCHALQGSGHAGLFGTVDAILDFGEEMLASGFGLAGHPLSPSRTHGWEIRHSGWSGGQRCTMETIGHTGFTGTGIWIDPNEGRVWTLLTNRVHPTRHSDSGISDLRISIGEALYEE